MYVCHIYIVHRLTNVLRGWEISYYARNRGAKIKRQHGTYHPASGPPSFFPFFFLFDVYEYYVISLFLRSPQFQRHDEILSVNYVFRPIAANTFSILFSSLSLYNCRFTLRAVSVWFVCAFTYKSQCRLINELHFTIYTVAFERNTLHFFLIKSYLLKMFYYLALLILRFAQWRRTLSEINRQW